MAIWKAQSVFLWVLKTFKKIEVYRIFDGNLKKQHNC